MRIVALALSVTAAAAVRLDAQQSEPSVIVAFRTSDAIRLDGRLDEPAWQQAIRVSNFTQRELDFGAPVSERTEVALLVDGDALYVGFWGYDSRPELIRASAMARPFSTLRFRPGQELRWGINFERNIRRKREQVLWQGWARDYDLEQVSHGAGSMASAASAELHSSRPGPTSSAASHGTRARTGRAWTTSASTSTGSPAPTGS